MQFFLKGKLGFDHDQFFSLLARDFVSSSILDICRTESTKINFEEILRQWDRHCWVTVVSKSSTVTFRDGFAHVQETGLVKAAEIEPRGDFERNTLQLTIAEGIFSAHSVSWKECFTRGKNILHAHVPGENQVHEILIPIPNRTLSSLAHPLGLTFFSEICKLHY